MLQLLDYSIRVIFFYLGASLFCNHPHNCDWVERSKGEMTHWMLKETDRKNDEDGCYTRREHGAILDATLLHFGCEN